jgi:hypothetical protein
MVNKAPFLILANMAASAVSLNFVIILKRCYGKQRRHFEFLLTWRLARQF